MCAKMPYRCKECQNKVMCDYYRSRPQGFKSGNPVRDMEKAARWRERNPDKVRVIRRNARAKRMNAPGTCTEKQWLDKASYYFYKCKWCGKQLDRNTCTVDHIIPLSKGGTNWVSNLVPACRPCNSSKQAKDWKQWLMSLGVSIT